MCIICIDYQQEKLTLDEAWRNLKEMYLNPLNKSF